MDCISDHEDGKVAGSQEQQRKRERGTEVSSDVSPPIKKRVTAGEELELSYGNSDGKQDLAESSCDQVPISSNYVESGFEKPLSLSEHVKLSLEARTDSVDSMEESIYSTGNLSSCDVSMSLNETECESLESSLVCLGNSLEDISTEVLDDDREKNVLGEGSTLYDKLTKDRKHKKKRKRKFSKGEQETGDYKNVANMRPNYFVGVQVSNSEIHKGIVKIQDDLVAFEPALGKALVDVATSHITLLIARIEDEDGLSLACSALEDYSEELKKEISNHPILLTFTGVDNFSNSVLYAHVVEDEQRQRLIDMSDRLRQVFAEKGVFMPNMKPLNPHLTIAKMSKAPRGKGKLGPRKIDPQSYSRYKEMHFGQQPVQGLQLLAMNLPKDEHRYYYCCKEINLGNSAWNKSDHADCCFPRRPIISANPHRHMSTSVSEDSSSILASSVGAVTALAASLLIVYVVGKVSGRL